MNGGDCVADNYKLMHGDCLKLLPTIADKSIDMICCDLPYGITRAEWDKVIDPAALFREYERVIKDNGAIVLFSMLPFACSLIQAAPKLFRYEIIWQKTMPVGFLNAKRMPLRAHENILVFYKHLPTYNPQWWYSKPYAKTLSGKKSELLGKYHPSLSESQDGRRYPIDVIRVSNDKQQHGGNMEHSTGKPVPLLEWLIKTYTNPGETVLDNTMGGGSCGIACANTGRRFVGIEKDDVFFERAERYVIDAYGKADTGAEGKAPG